MLRQMRVSSNILYVIFLGTTFILLNYVSANPDKGDSKFPMYENDDDGPIEPIEPTSESDASTASISTTSNRSSSTNTQKFYDYRPVNFCAGPKICKESETAACKCAVDPNAEEITNNFIEFRKAMVKIHNDLRNYIASGEEKSANAGPGTNMWAVTYDLELEHMARCWTVQTPIDANGTHPREKCRRSPSYKQDVGQIIYHSATDEIVSNTSAWKAIFDKFYAEIKHIGVGTISNYEGDTSKGYKIGNFSQIVWWSVRYLGCARNHYNKYKPSDNMPYAYNLICNYATVATPVNTVGEHIYAKGTPCSNCDANIACNNEGEKPGPYNALCGQLERIPDDQLLPLEPPPVITTTEEPVSKRTHEMDNDDDDKKKSEDASPSFRLLQNNARPMASLTFHELLLEFLMILLIKWMF